MAKGSIKIDTAKADCLVVSLLKQGESTPSEYHYKNNAETDTVTLASFTYPGSDKATLGALTITGDASVAVPKDGQANATKTYTVTATDTEGDSMTVPSGTTWSIQGTAPTGVSMNNGTLTVTKAAQAGTVTLTVSNSGKSATKEVSITRESPAATTVKILKSGTAVTEDTLVIPVGSQLNTTGTYTAKLYDQYGVEMEGTPAWNFNANSTGATQEGGVVTVGKSASTGNATLTATISEKSATLTIHVTSMTLTGGWTAIDSKMNSAITYGQANSAAAKSSLGTGTATAGSANLSGTFSIVDATTVQQAGARKVKVRFTVTTNGDYKDQYLEKEYDLTVNKKPVTVTAANKTKVYGENNPDLTFTVPSGALVGSDQQSALGVTLSTTATRSSDVGRYDITGSGTSDNYQVSVTKGTLTINKATITGYTASGFPLTIRANDSANKDAASLKAKMVLPTQTEVTYKDGTATLPITWANATETFNIKGGTYTYRGTVTPGTNFNAYSTPLNATLTVSPVKVTAVSPALSAITVVQSEVAAANALTGIPGMPSIVTLTLDDSQHPSLELTGASLKWDKTLDQVKAVANRVTATADQTVDLALQVPAWATVENSVASQLTKKLTITSRFPVTVTVTQDNITYGDSLAPSAEQEQINGRGTDSSGTFTYTYEKVEENKRTAVNGVPTDAGTYVVTATLNSTTHSGKGEKQFTIQPKSLNDVVITLPEGPFVYNKQPYVLQLTVKDGDKDLVEETDYTVGYVRDVFQDPANVNAGDVGIVINGLGNYQGMVRRQFTIEKASIAALKPTISGEAKVGQVLTAALPDVADSELTWQWKRDGNNIEGATARTYVPVEADAGAAITVVAVSKEQNYTGSSQASEEEPVAAMPITGTVTIEEKTNVSSGTDNKIEAGDVVKANVTKVLPNGATVSYQWSNQDGDIDSATGAEYTVTNDDASLTVTVTGTGNYAGSLTASVEVGKSTMPGTVSVAGTAEIGQELTATVTDGPAEEDYDIVWTRDGEPIEGATGSTYTLTPDDAGKTISAKIVAKDGNETYTGEVASAGTSVAAAKPAAPVLSLSAGNGTLTANWSAPAANGAPILEYTLVLKKGGNVEKTVTANSGDTSYVFENLVNGTEYTVELTAKNSVGLSDADTKKATPAANSGYFPGGGEDEPGDEPVVDTKTDPDGTVTETTTWPDGKKKVEVTSPEGDKAITVTDPEGEVVAEIEIPAEPESSGIHYDDVLDSSWYKNAVYAATDYGMFVGTTDNTFSPRNPMTRAMVAQVLYALSGSPEYGDAAAAFGDVKPGAWYEEAVDWAAEIGVVAGTGSGFAPNQEVSREMLVSMLYRYAQYLGQDVEAEVSLSEFPDESSVANYAKDPMEWAVSIGLVHGRKRDDGNYLAPKESASRAEVATIMVAFVEYLSK